MLQHTMRTYSIIMLLLSSSFCLQSAFCQQKLSMIVGGVDLSLGMKKDEVLKKYENFKLTDLGSDAWMIFRKNPHTDDFESIGVIQFIKGRLYSASRNWGQSHHESAIELFGALFSALSTSTTESGTDAVIQTYELTQPGISSKSIAITVDGRSFTITITKASQLTTQQVEVKERIAQ